MYMPLFLLVCLAFLPTSGILLVISSSIDVLPHSSHHNEDRCRQAFVLACSKRALNAVNTGYAMPLP